MRTIDSHTRLNSYQTLTGLRLDRNVTSTSAYITECKVKRFIKTLNDADVIKTCVSKTPPDVETQRDRLLNRVEKMRSEIVEEIFSHINSNKDKALQLLTVVKN